MMASRLSQMQARFQQRQMQEKEEKLLRLYADQQQRTIERVNKGSAGSNTSVTSVTSTQGGKVRQMFDERRQKAGIDRSYPLEPIRNKTVKTNTKNGKVGNNNNKREVFQSYNNNGDEYYEASRYDDINANSSNGRIMNKTYNKSKDLDILMKNHHIHDNLDDEEFPDLGLDDIDEPFRVSPNIIPKKSPFKHGVPKVTAKNISNGNASPIKTSSPKKDGKERVQKASTTNNSPQSLSSNRSRSGLGSPTTPETVSSAKMSSKPSNTSRTPSAVRSTSRGGSGTSASMVARDNFAECRYCSRRFASDRIATHEDICSKTAKKRRKVYDATKHRLQGTELEPYVRKMSRNPAAKIEPSPNYLPKQQNSKEQKAAAPIKKTDWRRKHEEFIGAIRAAKMAQEHVARGGKLSDLPPPPPSSNPDYVQCPHCGRRFNEAAAARHIPKCASYEFNKSKPPARSVGGSRGGFR